MALCPDFYDFSGLIKLTATAYHSFSMPVPKTFTAEEEMIDTKELLLRSENSNKHPKNCSLMQYHTFEKDLRE
jgi:hypothetical protein